MIRRIRGPYIELNLNKNTIKCIYVYVSSNCSLRCISGALVQVVQYRGSHVKLCVCVLRKDCLWLCLRNQQLPLWSKMWSREIKHSECSRWMINDFDSNKIAFGGMVQSYYTVWIHFCWWFCDGSSLCITTVLTDLLLTIRRVCIMWMQGAGSACCLLIKAWHCDWSACENFKNKSSYLDSLDTVTVFIIHVLRRTQSQNERMVR